jgi:A/G-specific adenine glycosylase
MLQQTRVEAVIPYFEKWMRLFPTVHVLAKASEREVLNAWEGLGYYSRARNLHQAARMVVDQYNGEIPRDLNELRKLPGIGRYTLGAIASIAFDMDVSALDGNIKRVYARIFDITEPVDSPAGEKILWGLADQYLPKGQGGDYNQALMDLGATICVPKNPRCLICPVMKLCKARQNGTQNQRPVMKPKKEVPHYIHAAGVIVRRIVADPAEGGGNPPHEEVLLSERPSNGLLGGMWEFPNGRVEGDPAKELANALKTGYKLQLKKTRRKEALGVVQHGYTHFKVTVYVFSCDLISKPESANLKWVPRKDLDEYPMGKIDRQIAELINRTSPRRSLPMLVKRAGSGKLK